MISSAQVNAALAVWIQKKQQGIPDTNFNAMRAAIQAAVNYKEPETREQREWRKFREGEQRAADMRRERAQRKMEEDAAAHRRHLKSQGWDM